MPKSMSLDPLIGSQHQHACGQRFLQPGGHKGGTQPEPGVLDIGEAEAEAKRVQRKGEPL